MPTFPSTQWMRHYAQVVLAHPQAPDMTRSLAGRYRFVVSASDGLAQGTAHDLVVAPDAVAVEEVDGTAPPADVVITADYGRWKSLLTGQADFLLSFMMRRITVEGDLARMRAQAAAGGPLLSCLNQVPTTFPH